MTPSDELSSPTTTTCTRCGRRISKWERDAEIVGGTINEPECIDCLKESNPSEADILLNKATPPVPTIEEDYDDGLPTVTLADALKTEWRRAFLMIPLFGTGTYYQGLARGFYRGVFLVAVLLGAWMFLFRRSQHPPSKPPPPLPVIPWQPHVPVSKDTNPLIVSPSIVTVDPEPSTHVDPIMSAEAVAAADAYAVLLGNLPESTASFDDLSAYRDALIDLATRWPDTLVASQAMTRSERIAESIDRRVDVIVSGLIGRVRSLQSSRDYMTAQKKLDDATTMLRYATTDLSDRRRPVIADLINVNDACRRAIVDEYTTQFKASLARGSFDDCEAILTMMRQSKDTLLIQREDQLVGDYSTELTLITDQRARTELPMYRLPAQAFQEYNRWLAVGNFTAAKLHAMTYSQARKEADDPQATAAFMDAAAAAGAIDSIHRLLMNRPASGINISVRMIDGKAFEGTMGGIKDGALILQSLTAVDMNGNPIEIALPVISLSTDTWHTLIDSLPKRLNHKAKMAVFWRAVAINELTLTAFRDSIEPAWQYRLMINHALRLTADSVAVLEQLELNGSPNDRSELIELAIQARSNLMQPENPLCERIRNATYMVFRSGK